MKTLGKILTGGAIILESLFAGKAYSQNAGWLARIEVKQGQNSFIYQPNIKWQNVDRRAQTQFYLGANVDGSSVQGTQFSINPLIRRDNLDGAVAFFGELNQNSKNRYGLETGFNIDDVNFYLGHSREQSSNMTAGKVGKRFGKQKVELGISYTTGETDNQRFYAFLRTTLKDALETNSRFDFNHNGLEKAMLVAQLNASGDGFIPGARYVGTFTPEQNKHSFRIGFGKNRKFSYGSVDGATDFYFIPLNMINSAFLNYGNGTLPIWGICH